MNYDIIGDIHGYLDALVALLKKLGYSRKGGSWSHPDRQVIFLGDFIDRGPRQLETITLVRSMMDSGNALSVMGNHEFNAIAWHTPDPENPGEYLRSHDIEKNKNQHKEFLAQLGGNASLHQEIISWFKTLPLYLDLPGLRAVHACWHPSYINYLSPFLTPEKQLPDNQLIQATRKPEKASLDTPEPSLYKAVDALLKGMEAPLPEGVSFTDKDGTLRYRTRINWWDPGATDFRSSDDFGPVFFGHYWFKGEPGLLTDKALCLDYSVAKDGFLAAYRWEGEEVLMKEHLFWV
ncbi:MULTISPECIES: metallophosphoesterase [unclassified Oceanispirochaeta]|uniref:metallophosphoesterase n=1 Tax=unclassified Oceanispirochaeta TaxID=2635722 RepID=UPI000E08D6E5|nr:MULTISPECIES: metallophosphoesterase [unclassified Oceanispirochaeta]MBF9015837.1 metallophosphoesterase [Oceanispirochaeta sp. M2]NPD72300.1 metallophosphoesterase [Oceanispirochaeta sp. M1]RDG32073.1 metallophosphoesterase [Oceanispirochaeta sp. M1]